MEAAIRFVTYYNSLPVKNLIAFSEDASATAPPRYVLPSTQDFIWQKKQSDRYYQIFEKGIKQADSFLNSGIVNNSRERYPALLHSR
jgi:hypothetical protein